MGHVAVILGIGLFVLVVLLLVTRANEVFRISVRDGELLVIRGHVPPGLYAEIEDVVRRGRVERASIRAVKSGGNARLVVQGASPGTAQRLRNVFGTRGLEGLRADTPQPSRNLGQRLGWEWLAWRLRNR
ncbi:MAG: DUF3634 family protein [Polyangiales bacterium]